MSLEVIQTKKIWLEEKYCLGTNRPEKAFFLPFLLTFRSCNSPTSLSSCVGRITGACLSPPPRSWLCSWELGSSTWGSVGCQHPCMDTRSQDPLRARTCKLLPVWSPCVSRLRACVPDSPAGGAGCQRPSLHSDPAPEQGPSCQEPVAEPAVWAGPASQTRREGPCFCVDCPESRQGFAYLIWWKLERIRDFSNRNFAGVETEDFPMKYSSVRNTPCQVFYG